MRKLLGEKIKGFQIHKFLKVEIGQCKFMCDQNMSTLSYMKRFLLLLFLTPIAVIGQEKIISISIKLNGMPDQTFFYLNDNKKNIDSATSKNGELYFSYKKATDKPKGIIINTKDKKQGYVIWVENESLTLHGTFNDLIPLSAKGSTTQNDFKEYRKLTEHLENSLDSAERAFNLTKFGHNPDSGSYKQRINKISDSLKTTNIEFLKNHTNSIISTYILLLETTRKTFTKEESLNLFNKLHPEQQNSELGQDILRSVQLYQSPQIGQAAPEFSMKDVNGQQISLSAYRGRNVILIFWASWCGPCRAEIPRLKAAYEDLKNEGFVFISVSLDENKEVWQKAIQLDNTPWIHISDLKGWTNEVALIYGVTSIPDHFFITREGKLVGRDWRLTSLEQNIKEYLKEYGGQH